MAYGGIGRAARNWKCFDKILDALKELNKDETLPVQSGKPIGIFKIHADAPRVLVANSNLVLKWADWEYFNELDRKSLLMYGQMTAGDWIYTGSQDIMQGTYETFAEAGPSALRRRPERALNFARRAGRHRRRATVRGHAGGSGTASGPTW